MRQDAHKPRGKIMTTTAHAVPGNSSTKKAITVAFLATLAVMITVTTGLFSISPASDPAWNAPTQLGRPPVAAVYAKDRQQSQPPSDASDQIGALQASRLVPCMMPRAWQRDCQASMIRTASN